MTSVAGMNATTIELETRDGSLPVYEVVPDSPARGAIVVIQEAYGVNDHIEDVAKRFAGAGYHAVAPHLYHRQGINVLPYDDFDQVRPHMAELTDKGIGTDVDTTVDHLTQLGFGLPAVGIVGFCMGGAIALAESVDHRFGAAVTFYGGGVTAGRFGYPPLAELAPRLLSPWLGLFGDRDGGIPPEHVELLRDEAAKAPVPTAIVRYPEAGHAFHCDARPEAYHEASARDAWAKAVDWLARYLQPRVGSQS